MKCNECGEPSSIFIKMPITFTTANLEQEYSRTDGENCCIKCLIYLALDAANEAKRMQEK